MVILSCGEWQVKQLTADFKRIADSVPATTNSIDIVLLSLV
jgi:hypothetical protein